MTMVWDTALEGFVSALEEQDAGRLRQEARGLFGWLDEQTAQGNPDGDQRDALFALMLNVVPQTTTEIWTLTTALVGYVSRTEAQVGELADALFVIVEDTAVDAQDFAQRVTDAFADYDPDETERTEESILAGLSDDDPAASHAWRCLSRAIDNLMVLMSYERSFLRSFRDAGHLQAHLEPLAPVHSLSRQLLGLLEVMDDATVVVLDTEKQRGHILSVDGVTDLPQLHALLIDTLAQDYGHDALDEEARQIVDGTGAGFTGAFIQGIWSFWLQGGLTDGQLPSRLTEAAKPHHLPSLGSVAQLPRTNTLSLDGVADEVVVLLLGPSVHFESWTLQRQYLALGASMSVVRALSDDEFQGALVALSSYTP